MDKEIEKLVRIVYKSWKSQQPKSKLIHPDEEAMACFVDGKLPQQEAEQIKLHLLSCDHCSQNLAIQANLDYSEQECVPKNLLDQAKSLVENCDSLSVLEIIFKLKVDLLELINTTGDVLVGQEFIPAPRLRSRKIKNFRDEVIILKDFKDIRLEVKIENKQGESFNVTVIAKEKETQKLIKDLRITLAKDDLELESYHTETGKVIFENILLGRYSIGVSKAENKLASVLLDINK
jgi:hypothetical protein